MNKELLREKYKLIRKSITEKNIKDNIIYNKVINDDIVKKCSTILIYASFKDEVDTLKLCKTMWLIPVSSHCFAGLK